MKEGLGTCGSQAQALFFLRKKECTMKLSQMERLGRLLNEVLQGILFTALWVLLQFAWLVGLLFFCGVAVGLLSGG